MTDKKPFTTIDEYISTFPADIQVILEKVRQAIHKAVPEAAETMSYAIPTSTSMANMSCSSLVGNTIFPCIRSQQVMKLSSKH